MDEQNRIARIRQMEEILDRVSAAQDALCRAFDAYAAEQNAFRELIDWYESPLWMADFAADEAGLLPHDLKRGVLSEDAIYNLLADDTALREELRQFIDDQKDEEESCDAETEETGIR